jgi:hypothetical protein
MLLCLAKLFGGTVELHEALSQIAEIRDRAAAAERFDGYRAWPIASSGLLAIAVAFFQPLLVSDPAHNFTAYLLLWLVTAFVGASAAASGVWYRHRRESHPLRWEVTRLAIVQFVPCLAAGGLVTLAVTRHAPEVGWILPGVWQVLFSLGIFASARSLPKAILGVAMFYLGSGTWNLSQGPEALNPWAMGIPFGVGQLATAIVLYWNLEREHVG